MKIIYTLLISLFLTLTGFSQSCLPEGIGFGTQAQIDNFSVNYPNCTRIEGDVTIGEGNGIINLNGISALTSIGGGLWIHYNSTLVSISGLQNITSIGGWFFLDENDGLTSLAGLENLDTIGGDLILQFNGSLTSIEALSGVNYIGGDVSIYYNDALLNLIGLGNIASIEGYLGIGNNSSLSSLTGLEGITSISGGAEIRVNNSLVSLEGLANLTSIGNDFRLGGGWGGNHSLVNLTGLANLHSIGDNLWIIDNTSLTDLTGLDSLISIGGDIEIIDNTALTGLNGIDNITAGTITDLKIFNNAILTSCDVQSICEYLASPNGTIEIHDNITGCNTPEEVEEDCLNNCLPDGITFNTQAQIDSFQVNYPNCTEIEGDAIIGNPNGSDITNLNGLSVLTAIGGSIIIGGNHSLVNLTGLENLYTIGGSLQIYIVKNIPYGVSYVGNYALTSLTGLANLTSIGGNLEIINNPMLSTCESQWLCNYLSSPNGIINIYGNDTGCNSVVELANTCGDSIPCLPYGNYFLSTQSDIDNFPTSFPDCTELEGDLTILGFDNIMDLNGLNTLTSIGGDLYVFNCSSLTNLTGFENLTSIGGHLTIEYNELVSLTGLDHITNIDGYLTILGNDSLTSLTGLGNIDAGSITNLLIWDNYNLSTCDVQSICEYLVSPNGTVEIHDNATGCDSQAEVEAACGVGISETATPEPQITIYPNPASTAITISLPSITTVDNTTLSIYNVNAQQVISRRITEPITVLDIGTLPRGVYFVRITTDATVMVSKFIKQ